MKNKSIEYILNKNENIKNEENLIAKYCPYDFDFVSLFDSECVLDNCEMCWENAVPLDSELFIREESQPKSEMIENPKHYNIGDIEVIDVIDDWKLDFYEGNIIKYVSRAKYKNNEVEDLKKAQWYLDRLINVKELQNENN